MCNISIYFKKIIAQLSCEILIMIIFSVIAVVHDWVSRILIYNICTNIFYTYKTFSYKRYLSI